MPITDHEKILVHPRPSNDYLKAIPIKKRRFFFSRSPSPPPETLSPPRPGCDAPEVIPEPQTALSKIEGNPSQVNALGDTVPSVSCELTPRKAEHYGIAERRPDSSGPGPGPLLPKTGGQTDVVNSVTGQYAYSVPSKFLSPVSADCGVAESKPGSSEPGAPPLKTGGDLAEVNSATATSQKLFCQPCKLPFPTSTNSVATEKKLEPSQLEFPFSKNVDASSQMSIVKGEFDFHESDALPSSTPADDILEKKPEFSGPECHVPETSGDPAKMNAMSVNYGSVESCERPTNRDFNIGPKCEILPTISGQGLGLNMFAPRATSIVQEMALNMDGIQPCTRKAVMHSTTEETVKASSNDGGGKGEVTPNAGISLKQEKLTQNLQSEPTAAKLQADPLHLSLNRSNWDLNTPMDSWEGSSTDFSVNDRTIRCDNGTENKRLGLGLVQNLHTRPTGTDSVQGNNNLQKKDNHFKLLNPSVPVGELNSEATLDLQFKPPLLSKPCNMSVKLGALREMPFLSLATSPLSSSYTQFSTGRTVKSEPIESRQVDDGKVQTCILKPLELKHIKTEPNVGQEASRATISVGRNSPCARVIKPEPLANQSQVSFPRSEGSSLQLGLASNQITPQSFQILQNAAKDNSKALDSASKPSVADHRVLHTEAEMLDTAIPNIPMDMVDKVEDMFDRDPIPENDRPIATAVTQATNGVVANPTDSVSDSLIPDKIYRKVLLESCETSSLPLPLLAESLASNGEGHVSPLREKELAVGHDPTNENQLSNATLKEEVLGNPYESSIMPLSLLAESLASSGVGHTSPTGAEELAVGKDPTNVHHLSNVMLKEEVLENLCQNDKVVQSNDAKPTVGASSVVSEEPSDSDCNVDSCSVAAGTINTPLEQSGNEEDYEDGELIDPALSTTVEGSSAGTEQQQVKDANSISAVDLPVPMPMPMPMPLDVNDNIIESSEEVKVSDLHESDSVLEENKVVSASASVGELGAGSTKGGQTKTVRRIIKDRQKNDKCFERKSKSPNLSSKAISPENKSEDVDSQQLRAEKPYQSDAAGFQLQNSEQSNLAKDDIECKPEISVKGGAAKDADYRGKNKQVVYLNSALNDLTTGKDRYISSQINRERPADRNFRHDRSQYRWNREEASNERSQKAESDGTYGHPVEKCGPNLLRNRNRVERTNSVYGDRNLTHEGRARYPRPVNASEDGPNRPARRITNEDMANVSRLPGRRPSPQMPMNRRLIRDISPGRCIGRDVPDFALLAHEEKLRNMTEDMAERSMLSHPPSQYERPDGMLMQRDRSLSPQMRRNGPIQLPPNCLRSSPRPQQRSKHQWSPAGRSADGFNGPRELMRCRSPPIMRLERMQSPHEDPSFQEEMMNRRRGSPPYFARVPNDMENGHPREHDFPRPVRGPNRNPRRFNMIDPRGINEEECVGPPMVRNQIRDFGDGDEFVEDRCGERRGPIRPFRQHFAAGDGDSENFRFHVEDGPRRGGLRLRNDANGNFPEGHNPRDFDARFRNRLGNSSGRLRSIVEEQEENYRHHGEQEWRDAPFHDNRPKRRRF